MKNKLSSNEQFQNRKAKIFEKTGCEKAVAAARNSETFCKIHRNNPVLKSLF